MRLLLVLGAVALGLWSLVFAVRACVRGDSVRDWWQRIRVKDNKVIEQEEIVHGIGRVRDVVCAPDGSVYVVLNDPDIVVRLIPAAK